MNSSKIIKGFRGKKLLNQEDVAKLMNMSRQTYNTLENDMLHVDFTLIFKLLTVLEANEMDIDEFFNAIKQDYKSYKEINKNDD